MSVIRNILNSTKALVNNSLPTTGSNTFIGTQTISGSIIPATNNTYDLGDVSRQFRHLYLSSGSLYIDGQKVLGSTGNELQITTTNGQSIKILEAGSDNIILQSADGNIELKTSGGGDVILDPTSGVIGVKGTMTIYSGNKLLSSDGAAIQIGNDLGITGSITTTGNVNGVNLSTLSSSLDTRIVTEKNRVDAILSAADADKDTFVEIVGLINSVDTTNDQSFAAFYTGSNNRLNNLESATSSYETTGRGIVSGSSQIDLTQTTGYSTFSTSVNSRVVNFENNSGTYATTSSVNTISASAWGAFQSASTYSGSLATSISSSNYNITINSASVSSLSSSFGSRILTIEGKTLVSGSSQIDVMSTTNIARLATTGSNTFNGAQTITGSLLVSGPIRAGLGNSGALLVSASGTASTQAAIAIQQLTTEGDTIIFADFEPYATYGIVAKNDVDSIDFNAGNSTNSLTNYNIVNRTGTTVAAHVKTRIDLTNGYLSVGGRIGIGNVAPSVSLDIGSKTDAIILPKGTTGQRPTAASGMIRYNTSLNYVEYYDGSNWIPLLPKVTLGASAANPAESAYEIKTYNAFATNGFYWIKQTGATPIYVYCVFTDFTGAAIAGGPWTVPFVSGDANSNFSTTGTTAAATFLSKCQAIGINTPGRGMESSRTTSEVYGAWLAVKRALWEGYGSFITNGNTAGGAVLRMPMININGEGGASAHRLIYNTSLSTHIPPNIDGDACNASQLFCGWWGANDTAGWRTNNNDLPGPEDWGPNDTVNTSYNGSGISSALTMCVYR